MQVVTHRHKIKTNRSEKEKAFILFTIKEVGNLRLNSPNCLWWGFLWPNHSVTQSIMIGVFKRERSHDKAGIQREFRISFV